MVEPVHLSVILPVHENTVNDALARLRAKGDTVLCRFLMEVIAALWTQNRDQATYIEGMKQSFVESKKLFDKYNKQGSLF